MRTTDFDGRPGHSVSKNTHRARDRRDDDRDGECDDRIAADRDRDEGRGGRNDRNKGNRDDDKNRGHGGRDDDRGKGHGGRDDDKGKGHGGRDDDRGKGHGGRDDDRGKGHGGRDDDKGKGHGGRDDDRGKGHGGRDDDRGKGHGGRDDDRGKGHGGRDDDRGKGHGGRDDDRGKGHGGRDDDKGKGHGGRDDDKGKGHGGRDDDKGKGDGHGHGHGHGGRHDDDGDDEDDGRGDGTDGGNGDGGDTGGGDGGDGDGSDGGDTGGGDGGDGDGSDGGDTGGGDGGDGDGSDGGGDGGDGDGSGGGDTGGGDGGDGDGSDGGDGGDGDGSDGDGSDGGDGDGNAAIPDIVVTESGKTTDGTDVTFEVTTPGVFDSTTSSITARLALGAGGPANNIAIVVDISASTSDAFAGDPVGDMNGDGIENTILDAEIASLINLSETIGALGLDDDEIEIGLVTFQTGAELVSTFEPGSAEFETALRSLGETGFTNYTAALEQAEAFFAGQEAAADDTNIVYFLSDGVPSLGGDFAPAAERLEEEYGAEIVAVGMGLSEPELSSLDEIDNTGGAQGVTSTNELTAALSDFAVGAELEDFIVFVNGVEQTEIDETDLVEGPLGFVLPATEIGGLDPAEGAINELLARITFDDGTEFELEAEIDGAGYLVEGELLLA